MTLGARLRRLRGNRKQQEIADQLNIGRARYSHYETDHVQPDNDLLDKMADLFHVSTDYLLGRTKLESTEGLSDADSELMEDILNLNDMDREILMILIARLRA